MGGTRGKPLARVELCPFKYYCPLGCPSKGIGGSQSKSSTNGKDHALVVRLHSKLERKMEQGKKLDRSASD
jgi:hypothetical protein